MNGNEKLRTAVCKLNPDPALKDRTREAVMGKMKGQQNGDIKLKSRAMEFTAAAAAFVLVAGIGAGVLAANVDGKDTQLNKSSTYTVSENIADNKEQIKSFDEYMSDLKADIAHGGWYMQYCDVYGDESDDKYAFYLLTVNSYPYQSEGIRSMRYYLIGYDMDILTDEQKSEIDTNMDFGLSAAMAKKEDEPLWESQFIEDLWYEDAIGVIASTYDLDIEYVNEKRADENTLQNILDLYGINADEMDSDGTHLLDMINYIPTKNGCVGVIDGETTLNETQNDTESITYNVTDGRPLAPEDILPNMQPAAYRDGSVGEFNYLSLFSMPISYSSFNGDEFCLALENAGYNVDVKYISIDGIPSGNGVIIRNDEDIFDPENITSEILDNNAAVFMKTGCTVTLAINKESSEADDQDILTLKAERAYDLVQKGLTDAKAINSFNPVSGTYTFDANDKDFEGRNDNVTAGYLHEWIKDELEDGFKFDIKILGYDVISVTCWDDEGNYSAYAPETVQADTTTTDDENNNEEIGELNDSEKVYAVYNHIKEEMSDDMLLFDDGIFTIDMTRNVKDADDNDDISNYTTEDYLYKWVSEAADDDGKYYITVENGKVTKVECDYETAE